MTTKVIKQPDKISCVACVACMATDTRLVDFGRFFFTKGPPYSDSDFYRYLLSKGFAVGVGFNSRLPEKGIFKPDGKIRLDFSIKDFPAYVIVKSMRFKGMEHVVYWDGGRILDPNPNIKEDGLPLKRYEVIAWFPIIKFAPSGELSTHGRQE